MSSPPFSAVSSVLAIQHLLTSSFYNGEAGHLKSVTWSGLWEGGGKSYLEPKPGHQATAGTRSAEPLPPRGWEPEGPSGAGMEEQCRHGASPTARRPSGGRTLLDIRVIDLGGVRNAAVGPSPLRFCQYQGAGVGDKGDPAQEAATASRASLYLPPWQECPPQHAFLTCQLPGPQPRGNRQETLTLPPGGLPFKDC